jgi:hypothetical protein
MGHSNAIRVHNRGDKESDFRSNSPDELVTLTHNGRHGINAVLAQPRTEAGRSGKVADRDGRAYKVWVASVKIRVDES